MTIPTINRPRIGLFTFVYKSKLAPPAIEHWAGANVKVKTWPRTFAQEKSVKYSVQRCFNPKRKI